jgi:hypothetical protein
MQKSTRRGLFIAVAGACALVLAGAVGQGQVADATIDFGAPQPQPGAPGSPVNHVVVPNEVAIEKGGTVTFNVNGGGHGIAIYPVAKRTTRADIEEDLCQGGPTVCNGPAGTANLQYLITDSKGHLIINSGVNPPDNRVNYAPGQVMSAGAGQFLVGSTTTAVGTQVRVRFEKPGRFLVICMNRGHALNDWMFGFVDVSIDQVP